MTFGEEWGWGADRGVQEIFERFAEAGGNFIDTANFYTNGTSERIVGELVRAEREPLRGRHQVHAQPPPGTRTAAATSARAWCSRSTRACAGSAPTTSISTGSTPGTAHADRGADARARRRWCAPGKVLYVGISDAPAWVVSRGNDDRRAARLDARSRPCRRLQPARAHPRARAAADGAGARPRA